MAGGLLERRGGCVWKAVSRNRERKVGRVTRRGAKMKMGERVKIGGEACEAFTGPHYCMSRVKIALDRRSDFASRCREIFSAQEKCEEATTTHIRCFLRVGGTCRIRTSLHAKISDKKSWKQKLWEWTRWVQSTRTGHPQVATASDSQSDVYLTILP